MTPRDFSLAVFSILVLGINIPIVKIAVDQVSPLLVTGLRFALVGAVLAWIFPFPRQQWRGVLMLSVVQGLLHHGLMFTGMVGVDAVVAAIVIQLGSPFAVIFALVLLGERFGLFRSVGMLIAFSGVIILTGEPTVWQANLFVLLLVVSAMAWGFSNIQIKRMGAVDALQVTVWMSVFAAPQLLIASLFLETGQWQAVTEAPLLFWGCLLYTALGATVVGYGIWYYLLRQYSVSQIVPFSLTQPVIGVVSGMIILGETLSLHKVIGAMIVLTGVAIIQIRSARQQKESRHGD